MCATELTGTLTEINNSSFMTKTFPDVMNIVEICPLKKKDYANKTNHRTVSILSVFFTDLLK